MSEEEYESPRNKTYGFVVSHGYIYQRRKPKPGPSPKNMNIRVPLLAREIFLSHVSDSERTKSGYAYARPGEGRGAGQYLSALCALWRATGGRPSEDGEGVFDKRPALLREMDAFAAMQPSPERGIDYLHDVIEKFKLGGREEDTWGTLRWNITDSWMLGQKIMLSLPIWSPYDVPRLPVLRTLVPPDYIDTPTEWFDAVAEFYRDESPFTACYGFRAVSRKGGIGAEVAQTTINVAPSDQDTLREIAATFRIPNMSTLIIALAACWLEHGPLKGGTQPISQPFAAYSGAGR